MQIVSKVREPLVTGGKTYKDITEDVCRPVEGNPSMGWFAGMGLSLVLLLAGGYYLGDLLWSGIGRWGLNKTVQWAWDITNFVWWVGIGHAGTLISAVLLLFRQKWRTSINRAAEAMTIFAVICAAIWPVVHMGRPWIGGIWALPLPNTYGSLWVNFNSPLLWDVFAISTYFSVSLVFWFIGLVPDFATIRDRAIKPVPRLIYGMLSMGFNGSAKTWMHYEAVSLILAGLSTPLVLSVHTIVSMDFATSVIPGWHTTIFPPYFVAGAIFSGFAMVLTLMLVTRKLYKLEDYITMEHIEMMSLVVTITGSVVGIAYITEFVIAWYSGVEYEQYAFVNRMTGQYWWAYWSMMACNVISPQVFYVKKLRTNIPFIFFISIVVNIGMWFERFVIIVTSLHRDYLPSSWLYFHPTIYDVMCYVFTFGLFFTLFLAFAKYFPVVNMAEVKSVLKDSDSKVYKSRRTISNEVVPEADRVPVDL
ncbi:MULTISPECIES: NrfD/PsrC family molybdoenzyme membrane anchor subunit [Flammeovirga]|uniref:Polysulfide reductase NrfD n=1 Tax=Flammeovirga agarivorans TaxID=2726742 RepID=A0A7X8SJC8_9BACT|nr:MULTISPECIES: NrfD/PsrC family molybdoenzyme membrane anchor subunit [Flammeovirga]NLR91333.1 polysulfide reductase NrfD [Flammeovirga agarivorans]